MFKSTNQRLHVGEKFTLKKLPRKQQRRLESKGGHGNVGGLLHGHQEDARDTFEATTCSGPKSSGKATSPRKVAAA